MKKVYEQPEIFCVITDVRFPVMGITGSIHDIEEEEGAKARGGWQTDQEEWNVFE